MNSPRTLFLTFLLASALTALGCAAPRFHLTDDTAMAQLMSTNHVAQLQRNIPTRHLICMVDDNTPEEIRFYLGDDEGTHTTRIGFYRVTSDGRVWLNADPTALEDRWTTIK